MFNFFSKKHNNNTENIQSYINSDVDPIAEADVYFSYGREKQALDILKEAYENGDSELKSRINDYLSRNNKNLDVFNNETSISIENKDIFKYRVHCVEYVNGYSTSYRFTIINKYSKETIKGLEEIESYIENKIIKSGNSWVISFISDRLQ